MKNIFTISGNARHGKDTLALYMKNCFEKSNYRVLILHYADFLKFICKEYFGWNGIKDENGRNLLQSIGTDYIRNKNPSFWVDAACNIIDVFQEKFDYFLIPDARFPNEIRDIKRFPEKVISIHVSRPFFDNGLTEEQKRHISETALNDYRFDYYIINDSSLLSLERKAEEFVNHFLLKEIFDV